MKLKYILLLMLIVPAFSACDQSDDVIDIFTGKTYKVTDFFEAGRPRFQEYLSAMNETQREECLRRWNNRTNYTITFTGAEIDGEAIGAYSGRAGVSTFTGSWRANGENNSFSTSEQANPGGNQEDVPGREFVKAIQNAYKYEGDTAGNLTIYYKDNNIDKYLLLYAHN